MALPPQTRCPFTIQSGYIHNGTYHKKSSGKKFVLCQSYLTLSSLWKVQIIENPVRLFSVLPKQPTHDFILKNRMPTRVATACFIKSIRLGCLSVHIFETGTWFIIDGMSKIYWQRGGSSMCSKLTKAITTKHLCCLVSS